MQSIASDDTDLYEPLSQIELVQNLNRAWPHCSCSAITRRSILILLLWLSLNMRTNYEKGVLTQKIRATPETRQLVRDERTYGSTANADGNLGHLRRDSE
jgi:hypothetical protein